MPRRDHARSIWQSAVEAVDPSALVEAALGHPDPALASALARGGRVLVVGGGKAGAGMAAGVEAVLADRLAGVTGTLNVPEGGERPLRAVRLHPARPAGSNHPTEAGVEGAERQLALAATATPDDVALCLLSGGGSALLPAPVEGVSLADKQEVTRLLHAAGAPIEAMNCVRKHLSRYKGGRLAQAFASRGCPVFSLVVSDVVGDPLDVIASGPTAPDPTTFADAWDVLERFALLDRTPASVCDHLRRGVEGAVPETPKALPPGVANTVLGNNARALAAARARAAALGYRVLDLGPFVEGESREVGVALAGVLRSLSPPACLLVGGETTVALPADHGRGGRNQELVLAALLKLGEGRMANVVLLSGGTDGEDGPTDAAGALADDGTLARARAAGLDARAHLRRHDAYPFFEATGDLLKTGLTGTNVMDVRVLLIG